MGEFDQKRILRKLDLEIFLSKIVSYESPNIHLEQYVTPERVAARILYIAAYSRGDIIGKRILDLGCGTGRFALGASYLGAKEVVGIDIDNKAIEVALKNEKKVGLQNRIQWIIGEINSITGKFDTVLQNPPFGVQRSKADRPFLQKALEVGKTVYSLHNHPKFDECLIRKLKDNSEVIEVQTNPFIDRFIAKNNGEVQNVYAIPLTIPRTFDFHKVIKKRIVVDLYIIKSLLR